MTDCRDSKIFVEYPYSNDFYSGNLVLTFMFVRSVTVPIWGRGLRSIPVDMKRKGFQSSNISVPQIIVFRPSYVVTFVYLCILLNWKIIIDNCSSLSLNIGSDFVTIK